MSIFGTIKNALGLGGAQPVEGQKLLDAGGAQSAVMTSSSNPLPRHSAQLIDAYSLTPSLRSIVGKIASSTAQVRWRLYAQRGAKRSKAVRNLGIQRAGHADRTRGLNELAAMGELEEIVDHPFLSMLHSPNDMMTGLDAREVQQVHIELAGEAFYVVFRNDKGAPNSSVSISPTDVIDLPTSEDPTFKIKMGDKVWPVPMSEVLWFRTVDPSNLYGRGSGIAAALADELDIAEYSAKQISSFFWNQAMPNFIVSIDGAGKTALKRAQKDWEQGFQGFRRAYRTKWTGGKMNVQRLDTSFKDMNIVELRKHTRDNIAQAWGVPPELLGIIENSNRATITGAEYLYAKYLLCPRLESTRETKQRFVERNYDERLIVHYDSPVPADREFQLTAMKSAPGAYKVNEWRAIGSHDEDDNGEVYFIPSGVTISDNLDATEAEEPSEPAEEPEVEVDDDDDDDKKSLVKGFSNDNDIESLLQALRAEPMRDAMRGLVDEVAEDFGDEVIDELDTDVVFNLQNPLVAEEINTLMFEHIDGITDHTEDLLRSTLVEGIFAGESTDDIAKRINLLFRDMSAKRARSIAQNAVHQVANAATQSAMVQSGVVEEKQWVTSFVRSRKTHIDLHGQKRLLEEKFTSSSGHEALYPHGFGVASEDIGCRCTEVAVIGDPKSAEALDKIAEAKEADFKVWDRKMTRAVRKAFRLQRDELLDALKGFSS